MLSSLPMGVQWQQRRPLAFSNLFVSWLGQMHVDCLTLESGQDAKRMRSGEPWLVLWYAQDVAMNSDKS